MILFRIVVPTYNAEKWVGKTIQSIKEQDYPNFKCTIINDISTDQTLDVINAEIAGDNRFDTITNTKKGYPLGSIFNGIQHQQDIQDEDVIITLDGDDWFANERVLSTLADIYEKTGCLMTYGSYQDYPSGERGRACRQIAQEVIDNNSFREAPWVTSHLRTFKYILWRNIKLTDLRDEQGEIYKMAGDLAMMFPMLEMAAERSQFVEDILVIYNRSNPLNADKVNANLQLSNEQKVRTSPKYLRLDFA